MSPVENGRWALHERIQPLSPLAYPLQPLPRGLDSEPSSPLDDLNASRADPAMQLSLYSAENSGLGKSTLTTAALQDKDAHIRAYSKSSSPISKQFVAEEL
jgi:hypothetical protein